MKKVLALVLVLSLVLTGFAFAEDKPGKGITMPAACCAIGVVYKQSGNPYF